MNDKTSDKRYRITMTEKQLVLVGNAVELMMRTGMGQTFELAEWIAYPGYDMPSGREFDVYLAQRNLVKGVLDGIMKDIQIAPHRNEKSDPVRELTTLHEAIGHRQWLDSGEPEWDVRSHKPMMWGKEPVPKIERIDE